MRSKDFFTGLLAGLCAFGVVTVIMLVIFLL